MNILITGGTGLVGSSFKNVITDNKFVYIGSEYDLTKKRESDRMLYDFSPDAVIHLAAKVGGVKGNMTMMYDFYTDNIKINTNVIDSCKEFGVKKVVSLLSTCVYPDNVKYPLTEDQIHNGEPHSSNFGYAYAKRMLDVHSRAVRKQYNLNYVTAVPNNIYGPNDNFDLENGHVIPAIIRKIYESKKTNKIPVFWGSGMPLREFTYSKDIARAVLRLLENYDGIDPVNIGKTGDISIKEVVKIISECLGYSGEIHWDKSKPEGQYKKPSSNEKFLNMFGDFEYTDFRQGIEETCKWFEEKYPKVRGV
jgi:GDP-L-fucose synthase